MPTATSALGLNFDEAPHELPDGAFSAGLNVRFADGWARRFEGHSSALRAPLAAAYHVANYPTATTNYWIHSTLTGAYADDGTTQTDITGTALSGAAGDRFTSCVLGGVYVQNNAVQVPMYWGGDTALNLATVTGWDATWRCKSLRSFKVYLLGLNITKGASNYPSMVKWSHAAEPGSLPTSWDEADATKDAGEQDLSETPDKVVDGLALGDSFIVYKERSAFGMQLTSDNNIFRFFRLPGDHGMLTQNCAVQFPGGHVVLGASDVVTHSGGEPTSILRGRMRKWLFSRIDGANFGRSFLAANHARSEVWICYPTNGQAACNEALVWNYSDNTFGIRELPNVTASAFGPLATSAVETWAADTEAWADDDTTWDQSSVSAADRRVLMSSTAPGLYLMDQSSKFAGTAFTSRIERTGMAFGDPSVTKLVKAIYPRIDAPTGSIVYIQVGGCQDAEQGVAWSAPVAYTVGVSYRVDTFATGRFMGYRVYSDAARWRVKSMDFDVVPMGRY